MIFLIIDREAREIMHLVASVRLLALSKLNHLTCDLHLLHGVDLDHGWVGYVGQGRRSKVKVKCQKSCFCMAVTLL